MLDEPLVEKDAEEEDETSMLTMERMAAWGSRETAVGLRRKPWDTLAKNMTKVKITCRDDDMAGSLGTSKPDAGSIRIQ
jgi:hypothetical protein